MHAAGVLYQVFLAILISRPAPQLLPVLLTSRTMATMGTFFFSQDWMDFAEDGVAFMKTHLKNRGFWTGPIVNVRDAQAINPPLKRNQNNFVIAQASCCV